MKSVGDSEASPASIISIGAPLATWIDLTYEDISESNKEELLIMWSIAPKSIIHMLLAKEVMTQEIFGNINTFLGYFCFFLINLRILFFFLFNIFRFFYLKVIIFVFYFSYLKLLGFSKISIEKVVLAFWQVDLDE